MMMMMNWHNVQSLLGSDHVQSIRSGLTSGRYESFEEEIEQTKCVLLRKREKER